MSDIFDKMKAEAFGGASSSWDYADIPDRVRRSQMQDMLLDQAKKYGDQQVQTDMDYKRAMIQELLDRSKKYSAEKPYDIARAGTEKRNQALPALAIAAENPEAFATYLNDFDPNAANIIRNSKDPAAAAKLYLDEARRSSTPYGRLLGTEAKAEATKNVGELNYHARKYASDAMIEARRISAEAAKSGIKLDPKHIYAQNIMDMYPNDKEMQSNMMLLWPAAAAQSRPDPSGMALTPDGKLGPKPPVKAPKVESPNSTKTHTMDELRTLYPGRSDAEIKAAYKKKYNKEPK